MLTALGALGLLVLAGCADRDGGAAGAQSGASATPDREGAAADDRLVFQVALTGGFTTPTELAARLPLVSVYADGRVVAQGPVAASYPGPALPSVQLRDVGPDAVADLVAEAERAGVLDDTDLGSPPVADALTTRFVLVDADGTHVRDAYALSAGWTAGPGLSTEQVAARADLLELLDAARAVASPADQRELRPYPVSALAVVATQHLDVDDGLATPDVAWPGPPLPGTALGGLPSMSCTLATGDQARAVLDAAATATTRTPWVTADGSRWSVTLRPLLPHEDDCTDLTS